MCACAWESGKSLGRSTKPHFARVAGGKSFMAVKKVNAVVKLQLAAGKATPGPPVGSTLGPHGINIAAFTKEFNEKKESELAFIVY